MSCHTYRRQYPVSSSDSASLVVVVVVDCRCCLFSLSHTHTVLAYLRVCHDEYSSDAGTPVRISLPKHWGADHTA